MCQSVVKVEICDRKLIAASLRVLCFGHQEATAISLAADWAPRKRAHSDTDSVATVN